MPVRTRDNRNWSLLRHVDAPSRPPITGNRDRHVDADRTCLADVTRPDAVQDQTTTDDQIVDLVHQSFRDSGYGQFRQLKVYCDHGRVTLQGSLPTYYLKQVAQTVIRLIPGIRDLDNDVKVLRRE